MTRNQTLLRLATAVTITLAVVVGLTALSPANAGLGPGALTPLPGRAGTFRIGYGDPAVAAAEASRHRVIILNSAEHRHLATIKANDPSTIVLVYKDLSSARDDIWNYDAATRTDAQRLTTGVGFGYAERHHPEWFLRDSNGRRLEWGGYPHHWHMDIGNPDYQRQWLANVSAEMREIGWDGVFMDNANWNPNAYNTPGPAKYRTAAEMQAATRSMLARVGPALSSQGFITVANIEAARLRTGMWADWLQFVDGAMEEHFTNWSSTVGGPFVWDWPGDGWKTQVDQLVQAAAMGKMVLAQIGGVHDDREAIRYGLASFLLGTDGRSTISPPRFNATPWYPEFDWDLGTPLGPYRHLGNSVYRRDFTRGSAIVNASSTAAATIPLGSTYLDHQGSRVTSINLGTTRGAVLRLASPPATTSTTAPPATTASPVTTAPPTTAPPTTVPQTPQGPKPGRNSWQVIGSARTRTHVTSLDDARLNLVSTSGPRPDAMRIRLRSKQPNWAPTRVNWELRCWKGFQWRSRTGTFTTTIDKRQTIKRLPVENPNRCALNAIGYPSRPADLRLVMRSRH